VLATAADIADLAALTRAELPTMTALHDEAGWISHQRFGTGRQPRDSWTVMLRESRADGELIGFAWVDDAMFVEAGVIEPWWCINALVVEPSRRGQGFGTQLLEAVAMAGRSAGVALLFGQTVPDAVTFWRRSGFTLTEPMEPLITNSPARRVDTDPVNLTLPPGHPDRWFVRYLATEPGSVRSGLVPARLWS
jgi:GNAT superfamily N-acetyltransferase